GGDETPRLRVGRGGERPVVERHPKRIGLRAREAQRIAREMLGDEELLRVDVGDGEMGHVNLTAAPGRLRLIRRCAQRLQREAEERELEAEGLARRRVEV